MTTIYGDGRGVAQVIEQAIRESIAQDETVVVVMTDTEHLCRDLFAECDGNTFASRAEAEQAIAGLCEALGSDTEWVAVQR